MKVLMLGFDGVKYNLVKRWRLENLQQAQHGKLKIPGECFKEAIDPFGTTFYELWAPFVWASIITGKLPREIGLFEKTIQKWQNPLMQWFRYISAKLGLNKRRLTGFIFDGIEKVFEKAGFHKHYFNLMKDSKASRIFHCAKKPNNKHPVGLSVRQTTRERKTGN